MFGDPVVTAEAATRKRGLGAARELIRWSRLKYVQQCDFTTEITQIQSFQRSGPNDTRNQGRKQGALVPVSLA